MTESRICPNCQSVMSGDATDGLCTKCLYQAAMEVPDDIGLHIRCQHCRNPVELIDDAALAQLSCPSCDTNFSLIDDQAVRSDSIERRTVGHFELLESLGMGAFGTVWKARDTELDRIVAIKIPRKGQLSTQETELFVREAQAAAQLRHSNIVSVHEIGRDDDTVYIVSDYVDGVDLADWLDGQQLTSREAAELCLQIAEALDHAHQSGVIHRDLKPSNIMLGRIGNPDSRLAESESESTVSLNSQHSLDYVPHIMDFGLAKREAGEITMTADGKLLGTPAYMPPEQAKGEAHEADQRSDVYSLGVILFELLTGNLPFRGNLRMLLHQVVHDDPPAPRKFNSNVPRDLETICLKCLQKEPGKRYESAIQLAFDLRRYLNGEPIAARPVSRRERAWRWCRRNPIVAGLAVSLAIALLIGFVGITTQWLRAEKSVDQALAQEQLTQRHLFAAHMNLAAQALENENTLRAVQLLEQYSDTEREKTSSLTRRRTHEDLRSFDWHYLWRQTHREQTSVRLNHTEGRFYSGESRPVISPDGRYVGLGGRIIRSGNEPAVARIFDTTSGRMVVEMQHATAREFEDVVFSPDSRVAASQSNQGSAVILVAVWDVESGRELATIDLGRTYSARLSLSDSGRRLAVAGSWGEANEDTQRGVRIFEIADEKATLIQSSGKTKGNSPDFIILSSDGNRLIEGHGREIHIVDLSADSEPMVIKVRSFGSGALSTDGRLIAAWYGPQTSSTTNRYTVEVFESKTGKKIGSFEGKGKVHDVAFSPDGSMLAIAQANMVRLWDLNSGEALVSLHGHTDDVQFVSFAPDGETVVSAARTLTDLFGPFEVKRWDISTRYEPATIKVEHVTATAVSPDGNRLAATVYRDNENWILFRDISGGVFERPNIVLPNPGGWRFQGDDLIFSPDGSLVIASAPSARSEGEKRRHLRMWKLSQVGDELHAEPLTPKTASPKHRYEQTPSFSPDGRRFAFVSNTLIPNDDGRGGTYTGYSMMLHDIDSGSELQLGTDPDNWFEYQHAVSPHIGLDAFQSSLFSPDGRQIVINNAIFVSFWDTETGEVVSAIGQNEVYYTLLPAMALSSDGNTLATTHGDRTIRLWDVREETLLRIREELRRREQRNYNPDTEIYAGDRERPIVEPLVILRGHAEDITTVAFCPDGKTLASGGKDQTIRLWDTVTGEQRLLLTGHQSHVVNISFTPDGRTLISESSDGGIKFFEADGPASSSHQMQ